MLAAAHAVAEIMAVILRWAFVVMPIGVFALCFPLAARTGPGAGAVGTYVVLESALLVACTLLLYPAVAVAGGVSMARFARAVWPAQAVAVSTRSSLAALPSLVDGNGTLGLAASVTGFVLPLSVASFKLNRTVSGGVKLLFLAHAFGIAISPAQLVTFLASMLLLSFSTPGIPSVGTVRSLPLYLALGIPIEGVLILNAVDAIPDLFKTILNVTGDLGVAAFVARWAGTASVPLADLRRVRPRQRPADESRPRGRDRSDRKRGDAGRPPGHGDGRRHSRLVRDAGCPAHPERGRLRLGVLRGALHHRARLVLADPVSPEWRANLGRIAARFRSWWHYPALVPDGPIALAEAGADSDPSLGCSSAGEWIRSIACSAARESTDRHARRLRLSAGRHRPGDGGRGESAPGRYGDRHAPCTRAHERARTSARARRAVAARPRRIDGRCRTHAVAHSRSGGDLGQCARRLAEASVGLARRHRSALVVAASRVLARGFGHPPLGQGAIDRRRTSRSRPSPRLLAEFEPTGNCGRCVKCLLVMLMLEECGHLAESRVFPHRDGLLRGIQSLRSHPIAGTHTPRSRAARLDPEITAAVGGLVRRSRRLQRIDIRAPESAGEVVGDARTVRAARGAQAPMSLESIAIACENASASFAPHRRAARSGSTCRRTRAPCRSCCRARRAGRRAAGT